MIIQPNFILSAAVILLFSICSQTCIVYAQESQRDSIPNQEHTSTLSTGLPMYYDYTEPSLRIAVNPTEPLMNDYSLFVDYVANEKSFGISIGRMIANKWWNKKGDWGTPEVDDNYFPVGVYNGFVGRAYFKWYFIKNKIRYISPLFLFKDIHYDNARFRDKIEPYEAIFYERSEKTKVFGLQLLYGSEFYYSKNVFLDLYCGIGIRKRLREYTTFKVSPQSAKSVIPLGTFIRTQNFPTIHAGIKLGFGFPVSKK